MSVRMRRRVAPMQAEPQQPEPDAWLVQIITSLESRMSRIEGWLVAGMTTLIGTLIAALINLYLTVKK